MKIRSRAVHTIGQSLGVAALVASSVAVAAPAMAETTTVHDGADTTASLTDIRKVTAEHGENRVRTRVTVTDLRRHSDGGPASIAIWFDTDPEAPGPEYRLGSGLQAGTDFQLMNTDGWQPVGDPKTCNHDLELRFRKDVLRFWAARGCFQTPAEVRVAVRMTDFYDGSHPITDWMTGRREFTDWLASD